jgi:hypothetical protein
MKADQAQSVEARQGDGGEKLYNSDRNNLKIQASRLAPRRTLRQLGRGYGKAVLGKLHQLSRLAAAAGMEPSWPSQAF